MTQAGRLVTVTSTDGVDFTAAAAQDAALQVNLRVQSLTRGRDPGVLRSIRIISSIQHLWEVAFYASRDTRSADPNEDTFLGRFTFQAVSGVQEGGAGLFRYYVDGLYLRLQDNNDLNELHMELTARDAVAKVTPPDAITTPAHLRRRLVAHTGAYRCTAADRVARLRGARLPLDS